MSRGASPFWDTVEAYLPQAGQVTVFAPQRAILRQNLGCTFGLLRVDSP